MNNSRSNGQYTGGETVFALHENADGTDYCISPMHPDETLHDTQNEATVDALSMVAENGGGDVNIFPIKYEGNNDPCPESMDCVICTVDEDSSISRIALNFSDPIRVLGVEDIVAAIAQQVDVIFQTE